ncbi:YcdB/YcdC domain-containing protein [Desulfotomaculum sp. 1211_IL3151]|uniref:YcdB/YcdC domain-containing protein n=1 Tax=Desulfotomaculum sp. 1211_IL3151 TaxID=3084055 RepID=UPI002FD9F630
MTKHMVAGVVLAMGLLMTSMATASESSQVAVPERMEQTNQIAKTEADSKEATIATGVELTDSQQRMLEKYYQILPELKKLTLQFVGNSETDSIWIWHFYQELPPGSSGIDAASARLTFAANSDELCTFDMSIPEWATEKLPSQELAKQQAAQFIKRVLGDKADLYQMNEQLGYSGSSSSDSEGKEIRWSARTISFDYLVNGIPFLNQALRVDVDAAGHITGYYRQKMDNLDTGVFPDPAKAISQQEATDIFNQMIQMKLNYIQCQPLQFGMRGESRETRPVLMYAPVHASSIDALSGEPIQEMGNLASQSERVQLIGAGKQLLAQTKEEAAKVLVEEFKMDMGTMAFNHIHEHKDTFQGATKYKDFSWSTANEPEDGNNIKYVHLQTVADSGEVLRLSVQDHSKAVKEERVSKELIRQRALQFIQRYLAAGSTEMDLVSYDFDTIAWFDPKRKNKEELPEPVSHFSFYPLYQGIPVSDGGYFVSINNLTGEVVGYAKGGLDPSVRLPDKQGIVTAEVAKAEYLKTHPLALTYFWPEWLGQRAPAPYLVYMPKPQAGVTYIDALTGQSVVIGYGDSD